jgi:uncharacterized membrane protein YqjE
MGGSPGAMAADPSDEPESDPETDGESPGSLVDDVGALIQDGKTYAEAELAFQKTRLFYVLSHAKWIAIFSGIAVLFVVLAIVALVVGVLVALMPALTPIGATLVVTFGLLFCAVLLGMLAKRQFRGISEAFEDDGDA